MRCHTHRLKSVAPVLLALAVCAGGPAAAQAPGEQTSTYGGIEIGAKGVKATVIRVTLNTEGLATRVGDPLLRKTANTTLADLKDGKLRPDAIRETAEQVGTFFTLMQTKYKVPPQSIYIIGSSGVPDAPNKEDLRTAVAEKTGGKKPFFIDQLSEVRLSIMGLMQTDYVGDSLFIDVGSGSTKCGYFEPETSTSVERMIVVRQKFAGTVTFRKAVEKAVRMGGGAGNFIPVAVGLRDKSFTEPLADQVGRKPRLVNGNRVFLSGGIVWAMVTLTKPETFKEAHVPLTTADIEKFRDLLAKNPGVCPQPDLSVIADLEMRKRVKKDVDTVRDVFTPEDLAAGAEILHGIAQAFRLDQKQKTIYFAREGLFAWIYAYVKESATNRPAP